MEIQFVLILLVVGTAVGFAAGLLGIGGGMMLVPFLSMIFSAMSFDPAHIVHIAIATSLTTILFTAIASVRAHHKIGAIRWDIALLLTPGILIGSWVGPAIASMFNARMLSGFFAAFVGLSAIQLLKNTKPKPSRVLPGKAGMLGAGSFIGALAGMVGAGGGFISVPYMIWCNVPVKNAVATSAALGFPIALAGSLSYIHAGWNAPGLPPGSLGYLYPPALFAVAAASVFTAPLGARVAHSIDTQALKKTFAVVLFILASYMAWRAVH